METAVEPASPVSPVYESRIKIPYTWSAGEWGTRFLNGLKEGIILGARCPSCSKVFCPPKKNCGECFAVCAEWVEVGPEGTLVSFAKAQYDSPIHPAKNPVYGLVRLKGADAAMLHLIAPSSQLKIGMNVRAVFKEERQGHILDILHFAPL